MAEVLLGIGVVALSVLGLALGLLLRGRPIRTACEGVACAGGTRCQGCPHRDRKETRDA